MPKWKVIAGSKFCVHLPKDVFKFAGEVFEASEEDIKGQEYKVQRINPAKPKEDKPKRRGRPPARNTAIRQAPEDRAMTNGSDSNRTRQKVT